jgi:hypothetical protein
VIWTVVWATYCPLDAVTWNVPWNKPSFTMSVKDFGSGSSGIDSFPVTLENANPVGSGGDITQEVTGPPLYLGVDG